MIRDVRTWPRDVMLCIALAVAAIAACAVILDQYARACAAPC